MGFNSAFKGLMFTRKNFSGRHLADLYVTAFTG